MEVKNPRRLLIVAQPDCDLLGFVKDLTGTAPPDASSDSVAGTTHEWELKTPYYTVKLPIWLDQVSDVTQWKADFLNPEAKEVIEAVGAWIYCFHKGGSNDTGSDIRQHEAVLEAIDAVITQSCGSDWDGTKLLVSLRSQVLHTGSNRIHADDLEDLCLQYGFEFVDAEATGKNEFGESQGMPRIKEALEANEWTGIPTDDDALGDFGAEEEEMSAELWGLKASLLESGADGENGDQADAAQVDDLQHLMSKVMAIKETGENMPEEQRRRFAAKAIDDLMKNA